MQKNTVLCVLSKAFTENIKSMLIDLKASISNQYDIAFLYDLDYGKKIEKGGFFTTYGIIFYPFSYKEYQKDGALFFNPLLLYRGANHYPLINFMRENNYEYGWLLDEKVYFNGDWGYFFDTFLDDNTDFITSHIETISEWNSIHIKNGEESNCEWSYVIKPDDLKRKNLIKTFNVIYRLSKTACNFMYDKRNCFGGANELTMGTQLLENGYSLFDFGGNLGFSDKNKCVFYLNNDQNKNSTLREFNTWDLQDILIKNGLYYPYQPIKKTVKHTHNMSPDIALCCIAKDENKYIREWVEYHLKLGFNKIYINDNNDIDGERLDDVLSDLINDGKIQIIDVRGRIMYMFEAFNTTYELYGKHHDWMAFYDCDEFLELVQDRTIQEFISSKRFYNYDAIHVNWRMYGDNGLVKYEDKPVVERFPKPLPDNFSLFGAVENRLSKTIIRTGLNISFFHPHFPQGDYISCTADGKEMENGCWTPQYNFEYAYLKHYRTKTVEEFVSKIKRGYADLDDEGAANLLSRNVFFRYNEYTLEKDEYFNMSNKKIERDIDIYICTHKTYTFPFNPIYKVICGPNDKIEGTNLNIIRETTEKDNLLPLQPFYGEMTRIYYVWKNIKIKKYIAFCHYKRVITLNDIRTEAEDLFNGNKIAVSYRSFPIEVGEYYKLYHNVNDLNLITKIIEKKFSEYSKTWNNLLKSKSMAICNIFAMSKEDFYKYCEFIFGIMFEFTKIRGFNNMDDVDKYVENHKDEYIITNNKLRINDLSYQRRFGGFLCERLTGLFVMHNYISLNSIATYDPGIIHYTPISNIQQTAGKDKRKMINDLRKNRKRKR